MNSIHFVRNALPSFVPDDFYILTGEFWHTLWADYHRETLVIVSIPAILCAVLYYFVQYYRHHTGGCSGSISVHESKLYTSFSQVDRFRSQYRNLSQDNTVYLTQIKDDGRVLVYVKHFFLGLYVYFTEPINFFCLLIGMLQVYEYGDTFRTMLPLSIFALLSVLSHMYENIPRLRQQKSMNAQLVEIFPWSKWSERRHHTSSSSCCQSETVVKQCKHLKRGDLVVLKDSDDSSNVVVPADMILLNPINESQETNDSPSHISSSVVSVCELDMTGEDIVVQKRGLSIRNGDKIEINHYASTGTILSVNNNDDAKTHTKCAKHSSKSVQSVTVQRYTKENILYCGTTIKDFNGDQIVGFVIEIGNDCNIHRIATDQSGTGQKTPIQSKLLAVSIVHLYLLLVLTGLCCLAYISVMDEEETSSNDSGNHHGFIQTSSSLVFTLGRKVVILLNSMIPLSLQFFFNSACLIIRKNMTQSINVKKSKNPSRQPTIKINNQGLNAFQFESKYFVSDKTKTLTTGKMKLSKIQCSENGHESTPFLAALACTEITLHSKTGELLKNDEMEACVLQFYTQPNGSSWSPSELDSSGDISTYSERHQIHCLNSQSIVISKHAEHSEHSSSDSGPTTHRYRRIHYQPFEYQRGFKIGVIRAAYNPSIRITRSGRKPTDFNKLLVVIQGIPEIVGRRCTKKNEFFEQLKKAEERHSPSDAYPRLIASAYKWIDFKEEPAENSATRSENDFMAFEDVDHFDEFIIYTFHDFLVPHLNLALSELLRVKHRDFSMCTGDKASAALLVAQKLGLADHYQTIESSDIEIAGSASFSSSRCCFVINGELLDDPLFIQSTLPYIMTLSNRRVIYRAKPNQKQQYVQWLKENAGQKDNNSSPSVCFIGDGSNDVAALMTANVGVAINHESENRNVQNISHIVIRRWPDLLAFLHYSQRYKQVIHRVAKWTIMKHLISSFALLGMFLFSNFENLRDPANPPLISAMNAACFGVMAWYVRSFLGRSKSLESVSSWSFAKIMLIGIALGILNSMLTFTLLQQSVGLLFALQFVELVVYILQE